MKKRVQINGMHCAGCVNAVEKVLSRLDNVKDVNVQLTTESAEIEVEGDDFPYEKVREAIENAGYEVEEEKTESVSLQIGGMHCAGCSSAVEKALNKREGIIQANVNLTAEKAFVEYDSSIISIDEIRESIESAGYEVIDQQKKKQIS
ncbi:heavy-metal-associated domain-containing protein [Rhodohalobacter halophilus]|uniref:heavy-metal-associated domain-containing protein n=1 Tax=Rhodohalobacter halophilus TaxID=1812810 RepID=UPI000ADF269A|nr:heavy metal-associated domain-containing protein [Rhodohalobacter halophilus]